MSHFADSRDPAGIGYLILQDHGYKQAGAPDHARGSLVGVRVLGRRDADNEDSRWKEDELARGPIGGGYFWARETTKAGAYQFGWPAIVADQGWVDPGAAGQGRGIKDADKFGGLKARGRQPRGGGLPPDTTDEKPQPEAKGNGKPAKKKNLADPKNQGDLKKNTAPQVVPLGQTAQPFGIGGAWLNPNWGFGLNKNQVFGQNVAALRVISPSQATAGVFGIGVDAYNINVLGAATHKDNLKKYGNKQDADDRTFHNFGPDSVSVSASSLTLNVFPGARGWLADGRFRPAVPSTPAGWPDIPKGFVGKVEQASTEDSQDALWLHGDPRLVAVHVGNPFSCGSVVTDLTGDAHVDLNRGARLHSMLRVVKGPKQTNKPINTLSQADRDQLGLFEHYERVLGTAEAEEFIGKPKAAQDPPLSGNKQNWLAWNIGPSGQRDTYGGLVCDVSDSETASAGERTLAMASARFGGCFDVGAPNDKHKWGVDKDGNRINVLHIPTNAIFRERGSDKYDGPLDFQHAYPRCGDMDYPVQVHLGWNEPNQTWSWWTTVPLVKTPGPSTRQPDPTPPPTVTPPPVVTPGGAPPGPPGPNGPGEGGGHERVNANRDPAAQQVRVVGHNEFGFPALSFHAQEFIEGKFDFAHATRARSPDLSKYWKNTPMVGRLVAYGKQDSPFGYTQKPGHSTFVGGTADGTMMLVPPEIGIEHNAYDLAPGWVTRSTSYLAAGLGTSIGWGLPHLPTGGIRSGWSSNINAAGNLDWYTHDADGVKTLVETWGASGPLLNVVTTAINYAVGLTDDVVLGTATITITLPAAAASGGRPISVKNANFAGAVTVATSGGNIDGVATQILNLNEGIDVVSDGSNWWIAR